MAQGSHPLTSVGALPNVTVAFPGEHWSDAVASGRAITPGEGIITCNSGGRLAVRPLTAADNGDPRICIAKRTVDIPDPNSGPNALGPNEVSNQDIDAGDYVHRYNSGEFHLTLVDPRRTYNPGDLVGWDVDGQRPEGKDGSGSWAPNANADCDSVYEVVEVRTVGTPTDNTEGGHILTVRSLNGQF